MYIESFEDIIEPYKAIFFDSYGVLKNASGAIPGACDMFRKIKALGKAYFVLTNDASRGADLLAQNFQKLGFDGMLEENIISSGMLTHSFLTRKVRSGKIAYIGTTNAAKYIPEHSIRAIAINELDLKSSMIDSINALVLLDDEGFDWQIDLNKALNLLRMRNIPVIVANTDLAYPVSRDQIAIGIGGLSELLEKVSAKSFLRFGKPDAEIFNYAYSHINQMARYKRKEILMIGDTLETDIIGANKFGIDTVLVLSGNTIPDQAAYRIKSTGIVPTYVCASIAG